MPITIARGKIHRGEIAVGAQHRIDRAHALEKIRPVDRRHQAHARDHVADRHVHRALPLVHFADDLVGRGSLRREPLIQPSERRRHLGVLVAQALNHFHRERRRHRRPIEILEHNVRRFRLAAVCSQQPVRHRVGSLALHTAAANQFSGAPQIFDQHYPKRDGDRPQLADRERLHVLVGLHEPRQRLRVEVTVGMRDVGPRDPEHARISFQRTLGELGELTVESARQVVANFANLLFDDVKIIDQPFRRRRDRTLLADRARDTPIGLEQHASVVAHPRRHRPAAPRAVRDALRDRQRLAMLFQSFDAEQFRSDRLFCVCETRGRWLRRAKK